jgi:hypothetical protein
LVVSGVEQKAKGASEKTTPFSDAFKGHITSKIKAAVTDSS